MKKTKRIDLRISEELYAQLKAKWGAERDVSEQVRKLMEEAVKGSSDRSKFPHYILLQLIQMTVPRRVTSVYISTASEEKAAF